MGTNCLGPFLLNYQLQEVLTRTAKRTGVEAGAVRTVWLSSFISGSLKDGGMVFDSATGSPKVLPDAMENYMESKVGNVFLAHEWGKRLGGDGVISMVRISARP